MTEITLKDKIKAEAQRLGFFACGFAKAAPVDEETARMVRGWLRKGHQAGMDYMARHTEKRLNPLLLMPGVKTIVCLAMNYTPRRAMKAGEYELAAYALGKDYHDIMKQRLHELAASFLEPDDEYRAFVDTAPVLERYWAEQAGIGWTGRHHQLIIPHAGSMFFLGELFLTIELPPDAPMQNRCGTCQRCLQACPTQAIYPQGEKTGFDANRCLSYQLIENRGELSAEVKQKMGNNIYGCDLCQRACPWNKFAKPNQTPEFQPAEALMNMTRKDWEHLTIEDYRTLFKGSAVKRAKYEGLMRNIRAAGKHEDE